MSLYLRFGKRTLDVALSSAALLSLSPVILGLAAAIHLEDGGPIFYVSERIGKGGRSFRFYKFRSMRVGTAAVPSAAASGLPITRVGQVIRRTNLDELPQLLNILKGDMSIVGPRPAIASQERLLELRRENGALACLPGLTGLAQINSYDGMPEAEKAEIDGEYRRRVSFLEDVKIILRTFGYLTKPPPVY